MHARNHTIFAVYSSLRKTVHRGRFFNRPVCSFFLKGSIKSAVAHLKKMTCFFYGLISSNNTAKQTQGLCIEYLRSATRLSERYIRVGIYTSHIFYKFSKKVTAFSSFSAIPYLYTVTAQLRYHGIYPTKSLKITALSPFSYPQNQTKTFNISPFHPTKLVKPSVQNPTFGSHPPNQTMRPCS